jgi:hypothetical protein
MTGKKLNIECTLDTAKLSKIAENKQKLIPIIKTIIFCGLQNISLRCHRDDGSIYNDENDDNYIINQKGNFKALLTFRIDAGDKILEDHLNTAKCNATYISKTTQNDLIECCGDVIKNKILNNVHKSKLFSILADETTDNSISEQFSFCVRYFDTDKCTVEEYFIGFTKVENVTGENLTDTILRLLKENNLDISLLRGQGYDGAANMSGAFKGVQSRILKLQPLALYTHCANHRLNLVLNKASSIPSIRNTVGIITNINNFLRESAIRTNYLSSKITELLPTQKAVKAKKLCDTRWVERHDGILHFSEILPAIVSTLDDLSTSNYASSNAHSLSISICNFEFLICLKILTKCLAITLPLSIQLQSINIDYSKAIDMTEAVKSVLNTIRNNSITEFKMIFDQTKIKAEKMHVEIRIPRITNIQRHRANTKHNDPAEYYRINIFLP